MISLLQALIAAPPTGTLRGISKMSNVSRLFFFRLVERLSVWKPGIYRVIK
jgi:hypothetical protein